MSSPCRGWLSSFPVTFPISQHYSFFLPSHDVPKAGQPQFQHFPLQSWFRLSCSKTHMFTFKKKNISSCPRYLQSSPYSKQISFFPVQTNQFFPFLNCPTFPLINGDQKFKSVDDLVLVLQWHILMLEYFWFLHWCQVTSLLLHEHKTVYLLVADVSFLAPFIFPVLFKCCQYWLTVSLVLIYLSYGKQSKLAFYSSKLSV